MSTDPRLPELFERAAAMETAERERWLADLARSEPALAREISELVAAAPRSERFDTPAWRRLELASREAEPPAPTRVGPFRVLREIGRGGMGHVFLAEQEAEGFRRTVALKLLDRSALASDDVRRFRDEVRLLAGLEHPGIARFLDGGRSPEGIWYLALEYVPGVDLIEHARRRALGVEDRLRLFLAVLEPVEYAHARGIVHRDLKPANILVGDDGRPRLLDFGISKLVDAETGETTATRTETLALTPAYASPEQFRGERATAASDVYSLGVVLYELLAGRRPFGDASSSRAALERAVLEQDPDPPSTAARATAAAAEPAFGSPPEPRAREERPRRRLGRDLDAVCLLALRKEPRERYPTVAALAADLERYLDGRPVEALRGDRRYRAAKLVRRHRVPLAVGAALAVALGALGALVVARGSGAGSDPATGAASPPEPRPFPISSVSKTSVTELEQRFAAAPTSLAVGVELVAALNRAGRIQESAVVVGRLRQLPGGADDPLVDYMDAVVASNLDEPQRSLALFTRALATAEATGRGELLARARAGRARTLSDLGRREEARADLLIARGEAERSGDHDTLARTLNDLAVEELMRGDIARGEALLEEALAAARKIDDVTRAAAILHNLAGIATLRGRFAAAEGRYREAIRLFRGLDSSRRVAVSLGDLALALRELGRAAEVDAPLEEAIATLSRLGDDTSLAFALSYRAEFAIDRGQLGEIEATARELEAAARASGNRAGLALAERLRGRAAAAVGDLAEARTRLASARQIFAANGDTDHASATALEAAELELEAGEAAAAARLANEAAAPFREAGESEFAFHAATVLARAEARSGRPAAAERLLRELGPDAERRESVRLRIHFLRARAEAAGAGGDRRRARADLQAAATAAIAAWRKLDELAVRLELAALDADSAAARAIADEAAGLGISGVEARAGRTTGRSGQGTVGLQPAVVPRSKPPR